MYRDAIRRSAERLRLTRFITLTLDKNKICGDPVSYLRECFTKWRVSLWRKYGQAPQFIAVLEFHKDGTPHLHILIDRYIEQAWISTSWSAIGGGPIVHVQQVDLHRVSRYLSKYLTKELLLSAPPRSRRVTTSRGIHLFEKQSKKHAWELLKACIDLLYSRMRATAVAVACDSESTLRSFAVPLGISGGSG